MGTALSSVLELNSRLYPNKSAIIVGNRVLTYKELNSEANRLSNAFMKRKLCKGSRVVICSPNSLRFVIAVWSLFKIGLVPVPINVRASWEEIERMISKIDADAIIFSEEFAERIASSFRDTHVCLVCMDKIDATYGSVFNWEDFVKDSLDCEPNMDISETDAAVILYTGGITGVPKGAILTHRNLMHTVINITVANDTPRPEHLIVHPLPMSHISGFSRMVTYIWVGATYATLNKFDPEGSLELVQRYKATTVMGGPLVFLPMLNVQNKTHYDTSSVLFCNDSFSFLHKGDKEDMLKALWPNASIYESYGLTEGCGAVTILHPDHKPEEYGSSGLPLLHTEILIVDDTGKAEPQGHVGEIIVRGPQVSPGYFRNQEENNRTFVQGWLQTGDLGKLDSKGFLYVVDREKDMIKTGGENVYSREVEEVLHSCPGVEEASVIGIHHPRWGETIRAIIVKKAGAKLTEENVIDYCRMHLPSHKKPTSVVFVDDIPKSSSGKVLKRQLKGLYGSETKSE
jgi:acyl-CoA synthetase (AMP-forming)/AMP-acid ligase II